MAGLFGRFSRPTTPVSTPMPVDSELEEVIDHIISSVPIPPQYIDGITVELRKVLRSIDRKRYPEIVARSTHPCVKEYLPQVIQLLNSQQAQVNRLSRELKGDDLRIALEDTDRQKQTYYVGIAELLGKGFTDSLRPNLIFDISGNPIGIRPKDQTRFPACHKALTGAGRKKKTRKVIKKKRKTLRRIRHKIH